VRDVDQAVVFGVHDQHWIPVRSQFLLVVEVSLDFRKNVSMPKHRIRSRRQRPLAADSVH
jgi:hypothetical protein